MAKRLANKKYESKDIYRNVLNYFFSYSDSPVGLNSLSKNIGASKTSVKRIVLELTKKEFLKKEIVGKTWRISAEKNNPSFIAKKIPYNLEKIYESGIVSDIYHKFPNARAIILFGSYRWGTDNAKSDIDIAVEVLDNKEMQIKQLKTIQELGYRRNVKVNLHMFSRKNMDLNLFTNIANGIVLDGLLEVHP